MAITLKERFHRQPLSIGIQCFSGSPTLVEILGVAGFDWVSLDMEHSPTTYETIEHLGRAAKAAGTYYAIIDEGTRPARGSRAIARRKLPILPAEP